jgi:phosphoribosylformimino-5-aminoimidazole carboxamide ribotide isomerase
MQVVPAIDIHDGNCVRLYQGDFAKQTKYALDALELARKYEALGFSKLHIVDLDGAASGKQSNRDLVAGIVENCGLSVQLGGGIRSKATLAQWLDCGVQRCVIGSVAVGDPVRVRHWIEEFGPERIVLALDVTLRSEQPFLLTHGWTRTTDVSLWNAIDNYLDAGLKHVLCTDMERDGAMTGPNVALYREMVGRYPQICVQASGGVRGLSDLTELRDLGVAASITGRAMLDGRISDEEIIPFLRVA